MTILAFLQNQWFHDPGKVRRMIARDTTGKLRPRLITYALFAGCLTGRRLRQTLGDWCGEIIWEESSPVITDRASGCPPPDREHIRAAIKTHRPHIVICLSKPAQLEVREACNNAGCKFWICSHPAARHPSVMQELYRLRNALDFLKNQPAPKP